MSVDDRGPTTQVYTVYPGRQGNVNYGFHPQVLQAPPPKYEDVVSGNSTEQRPVNVVNPEGEPVGVVLVTPVRYSRTQNAIGLIFFVLFLIVFVTVLIKILTFK